MVVLLSLDFRGQRNLLNFPRLRWFPKSILFYRSTSDKRFEDDIIIIPPTHISYADYILRYKICIGVSPQVSVTDARNSVIHVAGDVGPASSGHVDTCRNSRG